MTHDPSTNSGSSRAQSRDDERFRKDEHLAKSREFRRVYKEGAFLKRVGIVFYYAPNLLDKNRIGFSIRTSNIKLANRRNRIKRLLREAFRVNKKFMKKGFDIVLVVKRDPPKDIMYKDTEGIFLKFVKEAGILL